MTKIKSLMFVGMVVLLAACSSTPPKPKGPDLTGTWVLTTESPMGAQDTDVTVEQAGDAISGTISS